jgi:RNA polymerase-binding transcription factor DksA
MTDVNDAMSGRVRKELHDMLTEERGHVEEQIANLTRSFDDIVEAVEVTNNDDEHDPEGTTIAFERAQIIALLNQAKADLEALNEAIGRLSDGRYGVCEVCEGAIGIERLRAIPSTRRCIACA